MARRFNQARYPFPRNVGVVTELGAGVDEIEVGTEVYGLPDFAGDGAAADYVAMPAANLARKPRSLDHLHAAAIPLSALTAWQALRVHSSVRAGQRVLIHGGGGGVGSFAVQLASYFGAETITTASVASAALVKELGANRVIDYTHAPFDALVREVDVVLDTVGGETLERSWSVLRPGGTIISVVEQPSEKRAGECRAHAIYFIVQPDRAHLVELAKLADAGRLMPIVSKVFPLSRARDAYELGVSGHMRGKIVLRVGDAAESPAPAVAA